MPSGVFVFEVNNMTCAIERFWGFVDRSGDCWVWTGCTTGSKLKYGIFTIMGKNIGAHVFSWKIHHGEIPEGMNVCHTCDNPLCVNPNHLFIGTQKKNIRDMVVKGRHSTRLTWQKVREIRSRYRKRIPGFTSVDLAAEYGMSPVTILHIVNNRIWFPDPQR